MSECKVKKCYATSCKYNREEKCQLEFINISSIRGQCLQFDDDKTKKPEQPYANKPKGWEKTLKPEYQGTKYE